MGKSTQLEGYDLYDFRGIHRRVVVVSDVFDVGQNGEAVLHLSTNWIPLTATYMQEKQQVVENGHCYPCTGYETLMGKRLCYCCTAAMREYT